jgi:hypothetical protein
MHPKINYPRIPLPNFFECRAHVVFFLSFDRIHEVDGTPTQDDHVASAELYRCSLLPFLCKYLCGQLVAPLYVRESCAGHSFDYSRHKLKLFQSRFEPYLLIHVPGVTMGLSMMLLSKQFSVQHRWSVLFIVLGVALASFGEVEFSLVPYPSSDSHCLVLNHFLSARICPHFDGVHSLQFEERIDIKVHDRRLEFSRIRFAGIFF